MAAQSAVIGCHTVAEWNHQLQLARESGRLIVVDFTASWCGPCRAIAPIFAQLATSYPTVVFLKVDVDELKTVAEEWTIEAMPTFIFLKDGTMVDRLVGARQDELQRKIEQHRTQ